MGLCRCCLFRSVEKAQDRANIAMQQVDLTKTRCVDYPAVLFVRAVLNIEGF